MHLQKVENQSLIKNMISKNSWGRKGEYTWTSLSIMFDQNWLIYLHKSH